MFDVLVRLDSTWVTFLAYCILWSLLIYLCYRNHVVYILPAQQLNLLIYI